MSSSLTICTKCKIPPQITSEVIQNTWEYLLSQSYSDTETSTETNEQQIFIRKNDCIFSLTVQLWPLIATEQWTTPFGSHSITFSTNREVFESLDKWYRILKQNDKILILDDMKKAGILSEISRIKSCSYCKKKTPKTTVSQETKTEKQRRQKQILKYLGESIHETQDRTIDKIAEVLRISLESINQHISQLEAKGVIQKEFTVLDSYILTKDYEPEISRKYLEIEDYIKKNLSHPAKTTQASISLAFNLPYSIIGLLLKGMKENLMIKMEEITVEKGGSSRLIHFYVPTFY